jgi:fumarate hydratase, class II
MIFNFLHSVKLLSDVSRAFVDYCVKGIEVNKEQLQANVKNSLMVVTALSPKVGYDKAAEIAHVAHREKLNLKEACLKLGYLTADEFDRLVKPDEMIHP